MSPDTVSNCPDFKLIGHLKPTKPLQAKKIRETEQTFGSQSSTNSFMSSCYCVTEEATSSVKAQSARKNIKNLYSKNLMNKYVQNSKAKKKKFQDLSQ